MRRVALVLMLVLPSCKEQASNRGVNVVAPILSTDQYNKKIMDVFSSSDFKVFPCSVYKDGRFKNSSAKCIFSKLTREEVVQIIEEGVREFASEGLWVEDYGQYHTGYLLNHDSTYEFGFGVSRVAYKDLDFKSNPDIWGKFESDIIFTPIYKRNE